MVPSFLVKDEIKSGRLIPVLTGFLEAEYPINAIYAHRHHLSAKVRSFIDLLVKHFREDPAWADPCRVHLGARRAMVPRRRRRHGRRARQSIRSAATAA
jgi:hypothetical protein